MTKKFLISLLITLVSTIDATAATARRATNSAGTAPAASRTTNARAAVNARAAKPAAQPATKTVSARATKPVTQPAQNTQPKTVAARAGTTQKVISTGTKVTTATENTTLDKSCQEKYNGCMDAFCMLDNANGGRCICSNKHKDLDLALSEIERIDEMSYKMATVGVEQLEMGADADAAIAMAQNVADSIKNPKKQTNDKLDFSAWDTTATIVEDIFKAATPSDSIEDKTGDDLYKSASNICETQIPECSTSMSTIKLLYSQQIKSDCMAYENTIKKKRNESNEKLQAAERALRETALEQHQAANKYDLSKCTIKFKECMQTTGGCGNDFSGCATVVATDNTSARNTSKDATKKFVIQGAVSGITISASTYDTLIAKKPLCDTITKNCTAVADQVWDTFLKEAAPQIKSAEIIAEDNARQSCIANISACFQKACKDTIDPNDPDGSYDMCLSRPETMLNVCRVPLNACGIDATKKSTAQKSDIWKFVVARLAAIRANACSTQVKECLQSKDNCGPNYANCIGLDRPAVLKMCPFAKLTACDSSEYGGNQTEIENYIYTVALGVMLNVDNSLLQACQNIAKEKMVEICGSTTSCYLVEDNSNLGRGSLQTTQDKGGDYIISGTIDFNAFTLKDKEGKDPTLQDYLDGTAYTITYTPSGISPNKAIDSKITNNADARIQNVVKNMNAEFNRKISLLANDPKINMCVTGRDIEQITGNKERTDARFPNLLSSYADIIYDSLLAMAINNYNREYATELSKANSKSQEYRNMLMCYAMADLNDVNKFKKGGEINKEYGIIDQGDNFVRLSGVTNDKLMTAQLNGKNKTIPVSVDGTMIATEELSAVYEPGPQTCRLTSRLYACTGYEAIYEGHSESQNWNVNAGVTGFKQVLGGVGVNAGVGGGTSSSDQTHGGNFCNSFAEPVISEQVINFASGEAVFGNVTRSNMQSQYNHSSYSSSYEDNSWGIDLAVGVDTGGTEYSKNYADEMNNDYSQETNIAIGKGAVAGDDSTSNVTETKNVYKGRRNNKGKKGQASGATDEQESTTTSSSSTQTSQQNSTPSITQTQVDAAMQNLANRMGGGGE